ncbi:MAG: hypothetical protein MAG431_02284 [Chloroflexi bacterium]|nr:hypothetical protein [Chloroflexota bacterium]
MKNLLLILTGVGIAVVALAGVGFAFAQGDTPPEFPPINPEGFGEWGRGRGLGMRGNIEDSPLHDVMSAAIADAFGLTVEELDAMHENGETLWTWAEAQGLTVEEFQVKMLEARQNALQQAVDDGTITQEQADQMASRQGGPGVGRPGREPGMFGGEASPLHDAMSAAIADAFGLTVEELDAMHENGETLWTWAESQGLTVEEFQVKMLEARQNALQQAVDDGTITQEQADQMLEHQGGPGFGGQTPGAGPCQEGDFSPQGMPHGGRGGGGRGKW